MNDVSKASKAGNANDVLDFPTWVDKWDRDSAKAEAELLEIQRRTGEELSRVAGRISKLEAMLSAGTGEGVEVSKELADLESRKRAAASKLETLDTLLNLLRQ